MKVVLMGWSESHRVPTVEDTVRFLQFPNVANDRSHVVVRHSRLRRHVPEVPVMAGGSSFRRDEE